MRNHSQDKTFLIGLSYLRVIYIGHLDYYLANFYSPHNSLGVSEWVKLSNEKIVPLKRKYQYESVLLAIDELHSTEIPTIFWFFKENIVYWVQEQCLLTEAYSNTFPAQVSFAFPKRSAYMEIMNYQIMKLWENGAMNTLKRKHLLLSQYCKGSEKNAKSLSIKKLTSLFTVLFVGFTVSLILVVIEQLARKVLISKNLSETGYNVKHEGVEPLDRLLKDFGISDQDKFKKELCLILQHNIPQLQH